MSFFGGFGSSSNQSNSGAPQWSWDNEGSWDTYDAATSTQIENAFMANQTVVQLSEGYFRRRRGQYEIQFDYRSNTAYQVNTRTSYRRQLRRVPDMSQREMEPAPLSSAQQSQYNAIFAQYRDPDEPDAIGGQGLVNLFGDLRVEPNGKIGLTLFWKFKCEDIGYISQDEFMNGMNRLGCSSIKDLKRVMDRVPSELNDPATFRKFYKAIFDITRNSQESNKKTIAADMAIGLLQILLSDMYGEHITRLQRYLEDVVLQANANERINSDQWTSILEFCRTVNPSTMEGYEDDGAWPVLIDEYVEWAKQ